MFKLSNVRNKVLTGVITIAEKAKAKPDPHAEALNNILDDDAMSDQDKLQAMRDYFNQAVDTIVKEHSNA